MSLRSTKSSQTIVFHHDTLSFRGSMRAVYDYAHALELLGYTCILSIVESPSPTSFSVYKWLANRFTVVFDPASLPKTFDVLYYITHGEPNYIWSIIARTLASKAGARLAVHCVFSMEHPWGDICAAVSEQIATKFKQTRFVPHMIQPWIPSLIQPLPYDYRNCMVFGHYGGENSFDIEWVKETIREIVRKNPWIRFLFMNSEPFDDHPSILFLRGTSSVEFKRRFIVTTDAMIMPESLGHTFGLAMTEFMMAGKPIIVYNENVWNDAHLQLLGSKARLFSNPRQFQEHLLSTKKKEYVDYRNILSQYTPSKVIKQFEETFLIQD